MRNNSEQMNKK